MKTFEQFCQDIQAFVGNIQLRSSDIKTLQWLYKASAGDDMLVDFIKKNCPYRLPENWQHWYESMYGSVTVPDSIDYGFSQ